MQYMDGVVKPMTKGVKVLLKQSKSAGAEGERAKDQTRYISFPAPKIQKLFKYFRIESNHNVSLENTAGRIESSLPESWDF